MTFFFKSGSEEVSYVADLKRRLAYVYHSGIQSGELAVGQKEALDRLLREHRAASVSRDETVNEKTKINGVNGHTAAAST